MRGGATEPRPRFGWRAGTGAVGLRPRFGWPAGTGPVGAAGSRGTGSIRSRLNRILARSGIGMGDTQGLFKEDWFGKYKYTKIIETSHGKKSIPDS